MFLIRIFARCAPFVTMAASGLLLSACATMFARDQTVTISPSQEAGNGGQVVVTTSSGTQRVQIPATIGVRSGSSRIIVRLQDARYNPTEVRAGRSIRGVYWVNILNSGVGFLIDWMTGAMWAHESFIVVPTDLEGNP